MCSRKNKGTGKKRIQTINYERNFLKKQGRNNSILYATENDTIEKKNLMMQIKDELLE